MQLTRFCHNFLVLFCLLNNLDPLCKTLIELLVIMIILFILAPQVDCAIFHLKDDRMDICFGYAEWRKQIILLRNENFHLETVIYNPKSTVK